MARPAVRPLDRWVEAGLISPEQRQAIEAFEHTDGERGRARPIVAEILGSLGSIGAVVAAVIGTAMLWDDLEPWARVAVPLLGAVILLGAGAGLPRGEDRSLDRLGALLWLLGTGAVAAAVAIWSSDVVEWDGQNVALATGAVTTALALVLVRLRPEAHQVLAVVGGVTALTMGLVSQYDHVRPEQVGVVLVCLGIGVALTGWGGLLPSPATCYVTGGALAGVGAQMIGEWSPWWAVAVSAVLAAGWLVAAVIERSRALLVAGLLLALSSVVRGVVEASRDRGPDEGGGSGVVLAVFLAGLLLVGAAIVAGRGRPRSGSEHSDE